MKSIRGSLAILCTAAALAACGGGGGGGGGASEAPPPAPSLAITVDNADNVAAEVTRINESEQGAGPIRDLDADGNNAKARQAARPVARSMAKAGALLARGEVRIQAPVFDDCSGGGSIGTEASDEQFRPGSTLTVSFNQCTEGDTTTVGVLTYRIIAASSNPGVGTLSASLSMDDFQVITTGGPTVRFDADLAVTFTVRLNVQTGELESLSGTIVSNSFTFEESFNGQEVASLRLNALRISVTVAVGGVEQQTIEYTLSGDFKSAGSGAVRVQTLVPFETDPGGINPARGQLRITGGSGATVTLTALDATNVQLVTHLDDGSPPTTQTLTWDELRTLAKESPLP